MPRLLRISPIDVPVHLIQRGNNRQVCFASEEDYGAYVGWLTEYAKKYIVILGTLLLTLQNTEEKPAKIQYIPATGLRRIGLNSRVMILNSNQKTYMLILMTTRNAGQWL